LVNDVGFFELAYNRVLYFNLNLEKRHSISNGTVGIGGHKSFPNIVGNIQ
jgi:hypothetical protein